MKPLVFCFLILFFIFSDIKAQTIPLKNPSFEDIPMASVPPTCWTDCGQLGETPTDIQPNLTFNVDKKPQHGNTYLGMVTRDTDTWEAVGQMLETPLIGGNCYNFSVFLARSESYLSIRKNDTDPVQFTEPVILRIWGGMNYCDKKELLAETKVIEHSEWKRYLFSIKPHRNYDFILLEVFYETPTLRTYNGNLLLDNCSALTAISCDSKIDSIRYIDNMCEANPSIFNTVKIVSNRDNFKISSNWITKGLVDSLKPYINLPEITRIEYLHTVNEELSQYYAYGIITMEEAKIQTAVNLLLNTKGIALDYNASIRGLVKKTNDKRLIYLEQELRKINKDIAKAEMMSLTERINHPNGLIEIAPMYEYRDNVITKIRLKLKKSTNRTFQWQEVRDKLEDNEICVDFVRFNYPFSTYQYSVAIISKQLPKPQFIHLGNEEAILSPLRINDNGRPEYLQDKQSRQELHKNIWQPLLPYLEGITTVHISPAGLLHRVSFEALQDEKRQYLGEQFEFHYYSSMRDFIKKDSTNHSYKDAVLMGNILYDLEDISKYQKEEWYTMRDARGKVTPLEATLEEVAKINNICSNSTIESTLLTVDKATEDTVQYFSGEHAPSILHFATHGLYLEPIDTSITGGTTEERLRSLANPLQRSVLMLYGANHRWQKNEPVIGTDEDGILTALEVTALDLRKTDLVVLSACSTALGEVQHNTEGIFGLQRAFKLAGVDYVVASLWDVEDDATKDLMVEFYKNLLELKQDPATPLRNAKNHFREDWDPELWAGFILIE